MSDVWIAACGGVIATAIGVVLRLGLGSPRVDRLVGITMIGFFGVLMALHQTYVEFFRFQIIPFHLRYAFDPQFVSANGLGLFAWRPMVTLGATLLVVLALRPRSRSMRPAKGWKLWIPAVCTCVVAVSLHAVNINRRVQWFIPENLQMNFVEKFFMNLLIARVPPVLDSRELTDLAAALGRVGHELRPSRFDRKTLESLLLNPTLGLAPKEKFITPLKQSFRARIEAKRRPLVLVILMESMRPSEIGVFSATRPSLTPAFDRLAGRGILFEAAYATGTVTRSGQEAVWCGYLSGLDTSAMRGRSDVTLDCLPKLIKGSPGGPWRGETFWYHGGDARFDAQKAFWLNQRVDHFLTLQDFPDEAPRTGWGVGDLRFFSTAFDRLEDLRRTSTADYLFGMALSVSNHIPWEMPSDAPGALASNAIGLEHKMYLTTAYSDYALGEFTSKLRESGLWQDSLIVIASDHGNLETPYVHSKDAGEVAAGRLLSHIPILLTGGMIEDLTPEGSRISRPVSQAGIAAMLAEVLGIQTEFLGENILNSLPSTPVFADLGHALFVPALSAKITKEEIMSDATLDPSESSRRLVVLYYRAMMHLLNFRGMGHDR